jgi:hypothetical protein
MPCYRHQEQEKEESLAQQQKQTDIQAAVVIQDTDAELRFLNECAAHCELPCCGFNAIAMTPEQFRHAVRACGADVATQTLSAFRDHIRQIGGHQGLVRALGQYEPAEEAKKNYGLCAILIMEALEP